VEATLGKAGGISARFPQFFHSFSTGPQCDQDSLSITTADQSQILTLRNVKVYQRLQRSSRRSVAFRDWGIPSQVAHYFHAVFIFPPHNGKKPSFHCPNDLAIYEKE
jgi:hypothetical protein